MKRKIIVGNWKMRPGNLAEAKNIYNAVKKLAPKLNSTHVIVCPPAIYLSTFKSKTGKQLVGLGAQNAYIEEQGSYTGEVSSVMLKDIGASYVILGHSERRAMGETDELISKKVLSALEAGIHPILCVGELVRDAHGAYLDTLKKQIKDSLANVPKKFANQLIVAYEPVWAIGAKEPMEPPMIRETTLFVRKVLSDLYGHDHALSTPVLYGGSVTFRNAGDIMVKGEVDGLLVGRESVNTPGFIELLKAVNSAK